MKQLALDIGLATDPTLARFFAGPNEAALRHLQLWAGDTSTAATRSPVPTYLWGPSGSGKSHLLKSVAHALREQGATVGWLDPSVDEPPEFDERWATVLLDDVQHFTPLQQHAAFNWFVNAQTWQRGVLAAGEVPPADLRLREDLRTRLGWGLTFALSPLDEDGLRAALQREANRRGMALGDDLVSYLLTRYSRDLAFLMNLLDRLDRYALAEHRVLTVPLLKQMLAAETP